MRSYTLKSTLIMTTIDLTFMSVLVYVLGLMLGVIPDATDQYLKVAVIAYLIKTTLWFSMRIPLLLPIDRWQKRGQPANDDDPALVRSIYYFPYDFSVFYGVLIFGFFGGMVLYLIYYPSSVQVGRQMLLPGMLFGCAIATASVAIGVPVNLLLTAKFSRRLSERDAETFEDIPGKKVSLQKKMATVAIALGCAPSLLLFSIANFMQYDGLYQEAERMAQVLSLKIKDVPAESIRDWSLRGTFPFSAENGQVKFHGPKQPETKALSLLISETGLEEESLLLRERRTGYVLRYSPKSDRTRGVLVRIPQPRGNYLALSLVVLLACLWPLATSVLTVQTIVKPVAVIASIFHRIIGRGRTEETDRVPISYKDEVGRLAFNANRTLNILTEARGQLEENTRALEEKNRELEEAYRTKGEFLANMSHELRTPLNAIIGFSRLMKRKLKDSLPDRQKKNLELIQQSGEQLLVLVNDLLDFEKIEAGKLTIRREELELAPFLDDLESTLKPLAQEKELELVFDTRALPDTMLSDRERLRQILSNLLTNSVKYSDQGKITLLGQTEDNSVVFRVTDEGIGMTKEQTERIFDPFHQVDGSETRERGGVGLGLAIVGRLVGLMRGEISVQSTKGEGSTFEVRLPLTLQGRMLKARGTGPELLVVDDNFDYLDSIHSELSEAGFRVTAASSGREAQEKLKDWTPKAILLDIKMPEMDGWEVLKWLRGRALTRETPVVITSVIDEVPTGLDVDISGWLTKPFDSQSLEGILVNCDVFKAFEGELLIVEDDPQTAQLLEQTFEDTATKFRTVATEGEAKKVLNEGLPGALVLDLNLGEGSGWEVLTYLRTLPGNDKTKVYIYTASDLSEKERERLTENLATVVHKHGSQSLKELVNSVLS